MPMYVTRGCSAGVSLTNPEGQLPAVRKVKAPSRLPSLGTASRLVLPAQSDRLEVFSLRGEKVFEYRRTAAGDLMVELPRHVTGAGMRVVKYSYISR